MAYFLLDSNAVISYVNRIPVVVSLVDRVVAEGDDLCVCAIVTVEVITGTFPRSEARTHALLESAVFLPTSLAAAERAGKWRFDLARRGLQLSLQDSLIASVAEDHFATVVTANVRDFQPTGVRLLPLPR